jgi:hypothetical protein
MTQFSGDPRDAHKTSLEAIDACVGAAKDYVDAKNSGDPKRIRETEEWLSGLAEMLGRIVKQVEAAGVPEKVKEVRQLHRALLTTLGRPLSS